MATTAIVKVRYRSLQLLICGAISLFLFRESDGALNRTHPQNDLVVRCRDDSADLRCLSDDTGTISWNYDGNGVIHAPCTSNLPDIFNAIQVSPFECNLQANLTAARGDPAIVSISGPYACTDRTNNGISGTSMVVVLDSWCGLLSSCPVTEGEDVLLGCYGQYDWLSYLLQYNPIVSLNSSIEFVDHAGSNVKYIPPNPSGTLVRPPPSEVLQTTYLIPGSQVKAGESIVQTCRIQFNFSRDTAYSGRNTYAENPLEWTCSINTPVNYCPRNVTITPLDECQAGKNVTCSADSYPAAEFIWTDNLSGGVVVGTGSTYTLQAGPYDLTCTALIFANCSTDHAPCTQSGSVAASDPSFPFSAFNRSATTSSVRCNATTTVSGTAITCPENITLTPLNGSHCHPDHVVLDRPSTVSFQCAFVDTPTPTYVWYLDGVELQRSASGRADIALGSGTQTVRCQALLEGSTPGQNCTCRRDASITVTVVECTNNVTISPTTQCVPENTELTCASHGHPAPAEHSWYRDGASVPVQTGANYTLTGLGPFSLTCSANYTHPFCSHSAICNANYSGVAYVCPDNVTLSPLNSSLPADLTFSTDTVLSLECSFQTAFAASYRWFLTPGGLQPETTSIIDRLFTPGTTSVLCEASYTIDGCLCNRTRSFDITVLGPTTTPAEPTTTVQYTTTRPGGAIHTGTGTSTTTEAGTFTTANVTRPAPHCPFPHWPPVIPPIVAALLSVLLTLCYCYSCGPYSVDHWMDERERFWDEYREEEAPASRCRPVQPATRCSTPPMVFGAARSTCRPVLMFHTNGYGRM